MSEPNLFEFVETLANGGLLRRVSHGVASRFELAEFTRQLRGGQAETPAVLFEKVDSTPFSVLASVYGSEAAVAKAFGVDDFSALPERIRNWLRPRGGRGVRDVLAMLPSLTRALAWSDSGRQARCQQVVRLGRDVDLTSLPIPHCWPAESGPTLTGGLLITRDGDGEQTVETSIAEVVDPQTIRVRLSTDSPALEAWNKSRAAGRQLDAVYALGGPPALWPTVWLGEVLGIDAMVLGELLGRPQPETVRGRTVTATLPAACEVVLEGRIDPEAPPAEPGRVATAWGRVSAEGAWATVSIHAITHAAAAIVPVAIQHRPPHDMSMLDRLAEACLEQLVTSLIPGVAWLRTPAFGAARQTVLLGIHEQRSSRAKEIAAAVRGLHSLSRAKCVILVDEAIDPGNPAELLTACVEWTAPSRDIQILESPLNPDDPSGNTAGSAVIVDATSAVASQTMRKARPSPAAAEKVRQMLGDG